MTAASAIKEGAVLQHIQQTERRDEQRYPKYDSQNRYLKAIDNLIIKQDAFVNIMTDYTADATITVSINIEKIGLNHFCMYYLLPITTEKLT